MEDLDITDNLEFSILNELLTNNRFFDVVFSHIRSAIFINPEYRTFFEKLKEYFIEYKSIPSIEDFRFYISNNYKDNTTVVSIVIELLNKINPNINLNKETFIKEVEKYILRENFMIEVNSSIDDINSKKFNVDKAISRMTDVLQMKFDVDLGIDYSRDCVEYFDKYKNIDEVYIKSSLDKINTCVGGGFIRKASYAFVGRTNIGKTLILCSLGTDLYLEGYNVLYITAEIQKDRIRQRIDANILNIPIKNLFSYSTEELSFKMKSRLDSSKVTNNRLIIKDYIPGSASANTVNAYLIQLETQENFVPDVVLIDYLTMFKSQSYTKGNTQEHTYIKSVAEEFQGLAVDKNICLITAMQLNRYGSSMNKIEDVDMTNTSGSWDSVASLDFVGILFQDTLQRANNLIQIKVNKTRSDDNNEKVFEFKVDYKRMRLSCSDAEMYKLATDLDRLIGSKPAEKILVDEKGKFKITEDEFGICKKYI